MEICDSKYYPTLTGWIGVTADRAKQALFMVFGVGIGLLAFRALQGQQRAFFRTLTTPFVFAYA